jgi:hypothetical protein
MSINEFAQLFGCDAEVTVYRLMYNVKHTQPLGLEPSEAISL